VVHEGKVATGKPRGSPKSWTDQSLRRQIQQPERLSPSAEEGTVFLSKSRSNRKEQTGGKKHLGGGV